MKKTMYQVFRVFNINGQLEEYYWGQWEDANKANQVALELRATTDCFTPVVYAVEN